MIAIFAGILLSQPMMFLINSIISVIVQIIIYAGIVQGFYSSIILTHTYRKNPANNFLSALLIILSLSIIHSIFIIPYFHSFHHTDFHVKEPFIFLTMPILWMYVKKLNEPSFKFALKDVIHLLPFIIIMLISFIFLIHSNTHNKESLNNHTLIGNVFIYVIAFAQYTFYLIYILRLLKVFKSKVLNEFSNTENLDPAWLKIFLITFLVVFILSLFMMVIAIHNLTVNYFNNMVALVFSVTIFVFGYKGIYQQTINTENNKNLEQSGLSKNVFPENKIDEKLLNRLRDFMTINKPFQDAELTLTGLAKQIEISRNQLSELINTGTGGNFYDFVNNYRVEEVKVLMKNPRYKDFTLLAMAYEAGFPSKSTFNSIFKKFTGMTPSEYRNRLI